jgi:prophage regulatory protein
MARPKVSGPELALRATQPATVARPNAVDEDDRLMDIRTLVTLLNCSETLIYRMIRDGEFPAPIRLGTLTRWRLRDYRRWMQKAAEKAM